jgi:RNA polymerase sigma-70 factor (ECF subfamily)
MEPELLDSVRRARNGDDEAFRLVVERFSKPLWRTAWRVLGDAEAAEDAVQEAFLRAWKGLASFDERAELSTWLHRIAVNAAIDLRRKRQRRAGVNVAMVESADGEPLGSSELPDPLRHAESAQLGERIRETLLELSGSERTAFVLRHFEGQPIAEIARTLSKSENASKQCIFRAVRKLRAALGPLTEISHAEPV